MSRRRPRPVLLVAAAVGLCAIATGVSLALSSSPGGQAGHTAAAGSGSSAGTTRSPQPTPPVASSTTGPNLTSAGIAKTAQQYPPVIKNEMLRWANGSGGNAWSAVTTQLGNVTQLSGARLYSQLRHECTILGSSVQTARDAPPIPDKAMQQSYATVLAGLAVTSSDCRSAISVAQVGDEDQDITVNKAALSRSVTRFIAEGKALYTATAEIRTLRR